MRTAPPMQHRANALGQGVERRFVGIWFEQPTNKSISPKAGEHAVRGGDLFVSYT
jgi:hypothetical protein